MENGRSRRFAIALLTGVAAVVGGIGPASAIPLVSSLTFTLDLSEQHTLTPPPDLSSGTFSGSGFITKSFAQFDTQGGTRVLNSVVVMVLPSTATLTAFVDPGCSGGLDTPCTATAQDTTTFSVGIDAPIGGALDFALLPSTQVFSSPVAICAPPPPSSNVCDNDSDTASSIAALAAFSLTITTPAQLNAFIGSGSFDVRPNVSLSGAFSADNDNSTDVSASTDWGTTNSPVTIQVTYDYTPVSTGGVPEPGSILLLGLGLAGLGFARRKLKRA